MLGFLFGFSLRLGRLHFFLISILFAVVMAILTFAVLQFQLSMDGPGTTRTLLIPLLVVLLLAFLGTLNLYSMRIRDIGWNPVVLIPAWATVAIADALVANFFLAFAIDATHAGTVVGSAINVIASLSLIFLPSTTDDILPQPKPLVKNRPEARLGVLVSGEKASPPPPSIFDAPSPSSSFGRLGRQGRN